MKPGPLSVVAVLAGVACSQVLAETYKWVDANGRTHFSDAPPADRPAAPIKLRPLAPAQALVPAPTRDWRTELQEYNVRHAQEEAQQRVAEQNSRNQARECAMARGELDLLHRGRVFRYDANGERQYLNDKEIPAAIEATQERVGRYCQ
ncbi:MAG TPA: DUF4124 domain-containing protein [Rhodocyclaceae bacterium]